MSLQYAHVLTIYQCESRVCHLCSNNLSSVLGPGSINYIHAICQGESRVWYLYLCNLSGRIQGPAPISVQFFRVNQGSFSHVPAIFQVSRAHVLSHCSRWYLLRLQKSCLCWGRDYITSKISTFVGEEINEYCTSKDTTSGGEEIKNYCTSKDPTYLGRRYK